MPEYGNEKADICLKDREQMSAFWMKWILVLYKCSQKVEHEAVLIRQNVSKNRLTRKRKKQNDERGKGKTHEKEKTCCNLTHSSDDRRHAGRMWKQRRQHRRHIGQ